jgi:hypothetical protein
MTSPKSKRASDVMMLSQHSYHTPCLMSAITDHPPRHSCLIRPVIRRGPSTGHHTSIAMELFAHANGHVYDIILNGTRATQPNPFDPFLIAAIAALGGLSSHDSAFSRVRLVGRSGRPPSSSHRSCRRHSGHGAQRRSVSIKERIIDRRPVGLAQFLTGAQP